jgi:hypothetical protein
MNNGLLFSLEKEGVPALHSSMDKPRGVMLHEVSQEQKDKYRMISHTGGI